jgi:hypothetical protein
MDGHGQWRSLEHLCADSELAHLLKKLKCPDGSWATQDDVVISWETYGEPRRHAALSVDQGANNQAIGPELMFGTIIGERYNAPELPLAIGELDVGGDRILEQARNKNGLDAQTMVAFRAAHRRVAKELNAAYLRLDDHWSPHCIGSAANYCLIGYVLAEALLEMVADPGRTDSGQRLSVPETASLTLAYEPPHWLIIRGPHLPHGGIRVNYLEAYCRAGSTDADW